MMQSGFTHRFNGEPIPPRSTPYEADFKEACTDSEKLAKATKPKPSQTFLLAKSCVFYTKEATDVGQPRD